MKIEELEQELKNNKMNSIYLLYGEELFLLETCVKKIKKIFGELILGINYINIDETNIKQLISDIQTPAFGYEKKLIIIKNSGILKKEGKKKNEELSKLKQQLAEYISDNIEEINQSTVLVFIEDDNIEKEKLYKAIEKNGIVCNCEKQKLPNLIQRLKAIANAYKVNVNENTLKHFIECCGTNLNDLINELRKLIEYVGPEGTITTKEIELLSIKQMDSVIFDLTDNLGKKQIKAAMEVLDELVYNKEPLQKILITLYNHIRKIYITKMAEKYNKNLEESLKLKANQIFLVNKYKMQAKYFKEDELRQIIQALIDLDYNSKIGLIDLRIGLETILCGYCS